MRKSHDDGQAMTTASTNSIGKHVLHEVREHCSQAYPDECCGVIVSFADGSTRAMRVRNIQDELHEKDPVTYPRTARTAYVGHPQDLREALEAADGPGGALVAFYHSHPDHDAYFSAEDTAQATPFGEPSYPDALQIVVSVRERHVKTIKAFAWSADHAAYVETGLEEV
jgi:[CysO sulfur-carrier protein]-S-L-cysteine hydrolase